MNGERRAGSVAGVVASGRARGRTVAIDHTPPESPASRVPQRDRVGAQLARLTRRGSCWHDVLGIPVGADGAPVEHLLIGPGGVYTLGAKSHRHALVRVRGNVLRVDGEPFAYVSDSRHEALRASRCLTVACGFPVSVAGVVVVVGVEDVVVSEPPGDVHVLSNQQLRSWLRRRGHVLDQPTIAAVHHAARTLTVWTAHP